MSSIVFLVQLRLCDGGGLLGCRGEREGTWRGIEIWYDASRVHKGGLLVSCRLRYSGSRSHLNKLVLRAGWQRTSGFRYVKCSGYRRKWRQVIQRAWLHAGWNASFKCWWHSGLVDDWHSMKSKELVLRVILKLWGMPVVCSRSHVVFCSKSHVVFCSKPHVVFCSQSHVMFCSQ